MLLHVTVSRVLFTGFKLWGGRALYVTVEQNFRLGQYESKLELMREKF